MKTIIAWIVFVLLIVAGVWYYFAMRPAPLPSMESGTALEEAPAPQSGLVGNWQSAGSAAMPSYVREFHADGTIQDRFADDSSKNASGTWEVAPKEVAVQLGVQDPSALLVRIQYPEEAFYVVATINATGDTLSLQYPSGDQVFTYSRI